jgi:allantoin racemase
MPQEVSLMARRVKMIVPVPVPPEALDAFAAQISPELLRPDISISFGCAARGGTTLDSPYEGTLADAFCLEAGIAAAEEGFDAVCINSMSDSGVAALRSRLSIPVFGTAAPTYHFAAQLGRRFSIISMWEPWRWLYEKLLGEQKLENRLASIRTIGVPPDTAELLAGKEEIVFAKMLDAATKAVEEDGADVLVIGSTTMHQSHRFLQDRFDIPVLNPGLVAFKTCEMALDLGVAHSRRAYPAPRVHNDAVFAATAPSAKEIEAC